MKKRTTTVKEERRRPVQELPRPVEELNVAQAEAAEGGVNFADLLISRFQASTPGRPDPVR